MTLEEKKDFAKHSMPEYKTTPINPKELSLPLIEYGN